MLVDFFMELTNLIFNKAGSTDNLLTDFLRWFVIAKIYS